MSNGIPATMLFAVNIVSGSKVACTTLYDAEKLTKVPARIIAAIGGGFVDGNCAVHGWIFKQA